MIYVTVGSTHFDELIHAVDELAASGTNLLPGEIICQIGNGSYLPENTQYFRYDPDHWRYAKEADLVITHGGASVLYLIREGIPFVAVANKVLQDDHQTSFLTALSQICDLCWTDDPGALARLLSPPPPPVTVNTPALGDYLLQEAFRHAVSNT